MLKFILTGIVGVILGSVTTAYWINSNNENEAANNNQHDNSHINVKDHVETTHSEQEDENKKGADLITLQSATTPVAKSETENKNSRTTQDCDYLLNQMTQSYFARDQLLSDIQNLKNGREYDDKLHNIFQNEVVDTEWASATEEKILDMARNSEPLQTITISSVACKSTICEVKIPSADPNTRNEAMNALAQSPLTQTLGFRNTSIKTKLETEAGEMTVYIINEK